MFRISDYDKLSALLRAKYLDAKETDDLTLMGITEKVINPATGEPISQGYLTSLHQGVADRAVPKWDGERGHAFLLAHMFTTAEIREIAEQFKLTNVLKYLGYGGSGVPVRVREGGPEVRFLGAVSAGRFGEAFSDDEGKYVDIPSHILRHHETADIFAVDITGDSMVSEDARGAMPEGARAYFHHRLRPSPGQIVCCRLENEDLSVIKVFKRNGEFVSLESLNRKHRPIVIDEDNPARVEGVLIGISTPY